MKKITFILLFAVLSVAAVMPVMASETEFLSKSDQTLEQKEIIVGENNNNEFKTIDFVMIYEEPEKEDNTVCTSKEKCGVDAEFKAENKKIRELNHGFAPIMDPFYSFFPYDFGGPHMHYEFSLITPTEVETETETKAEMMDEENLKEEEFSSDYDRIISILRILGDIDAGYNVTLSVDKGTVTDLAIAMHTNR